MSVIQFSGTVVSRLALSTLRALKHLIYITHRSQPPTLKDQDFLEAVRGTLDRAKLLSDIVRSEQRKCNDTSVNWPNEPPFSGILQRILNHIILLRDLLIGTIEIARKGLYTPETIGNYLNNNIRIIGRTVKDIIILSKELEVLYPKETGSVLDSITQSNFQSQFHKAGDESSLGDDMDDNPVDTMPGGEDPATVLHPGLSETDYLPVNRAHNTGGERAQVSKLDTGISLFNGDWKNGLRYLLDESIIKEETKSIAQFLYDYNDKLSKEQIGEILAGKNENDTELLIAFTNLMDFKGDSLDQGLRKYLQKFMLSGESQKISRIMEVYATSYVDQNPQSFPNKDVAFVVAFSLIMLNTDAHNPAVLAKDKMTKEQFIWNNRGTWVDGADPPKELLEDLYDKIVHDEIKMHTKGDPDKKGWLKGIHAGSLREGRRWFLLLGTELRWYKNPVVTTTGKDDEIRGKIILECMQVRCNEQTLKISISSVLYNKNIEFYLNERGHKEIPQTCKKFVLSAENLKQMQSWAQAIRENVSLEEIPNKLEINKTSGGGSKTYRKGGPRGKNRTWRNSFANTQAMQDPNAAKNNKKKSIKLPPTMSSVSLNQSGSRLPPAKVN